MNKLLWWSGQSLVTSHIITHGGQLEKHLIIYTTLLKPIWLYKIYNHTSRLKNRTIMQVYYIEKSQTAKS